MFFTMESRWGHLMHDRVRGSDRGFRGNFDGGRPVAIGSHLAPHLRVFTLFGHLMFAGPAGRLDCGSGLGICPYMVGRRCL